MIRIDNNTVGYLQGCTKEWKDNGYPVNSIVFISAYRLDKLIGADEEVNIIDTRRRSEYESEHVLGSEVLTLDTIFCHYKSHRINLVS